jgi:hypothetical protein
LAYVDNSKITNGQLRDAIILNQRCFAGELKVSLEMIHSIEARMPVGTIDTVNVGAMINCVKTVYACGTN